MPRPRPFLRRDDGTRVYLPPHPTDACARKSWYETEIAARMGAQASFTVNRHGHRMRRLWVYPCERCNGWHITSDGQNKTPAITPLELVEGSRQP